jgi:hypothetical protein
MDLDERLVGAQLGLGDGREASVPSDFGCGDS